MSPLATPVPVTVVAIRGGFRSGRETKAWVVGAAWGVALAKRSQPVAVSTAGARAAVLAAFRNWRLVARRESSDEGTGSAITVVPSRSPILLGS